MNSDAKNNPPEAGRQLHRAGVVLDGAEQTSKGIAKHPYVRGVDEGGHHSDA